MTSITKSVAVVVLICAAFAGGYCSRQQDSHKVMTAARVPLYYQDPMHPAYRSDKPGIAPDCGMDLEPVYADAKDKQDSAIPGLVRIDADQQQLIGIQTEKVSSGSAFRTLNAVGKIVVDETRVDKIAALADGVVRKVGPYASGSKVGKDEVLATYFVASRDLYNAMQSFFLSAGPREQSSNTLRNSGVLSATKAEGRVEEELLKTYGVTSTQIRHMLETREVTRDIDFRAPRAGIVLDRNIAPGAVISKGTELFRIADLSHVWVLADVFEADAESFKPGSLARITYNGTAHTAKVTDSRQFDANSRTMKIRLELDNPGMQLRPDMFVQVALDTQSTPGLSVPADSVMDTGRGKIVFVSRGNGSYEPRPVSAAAESGGRVRILSGLTSQDSVVVSGMFLLDSESKLRGVSMQPVAEEAPKHRPAEQASADADPVCGMPLNGKHEHSSTFDGKVLYFCSKDCKQKFDRQPAAYVQQHMTVMAGLRN